LAKLVIEQVVMAKNPKMAVNPKNYTDKLNKHWISDTFPTLILYKNIPRTKTALKHPENSHSTDT
jgi:hypothetical protein